MIKFAIRFATTFFLIFIAWGIYQTIKNFVGIYSQGLWIGIGATVFLIWIIILKSMWSKKNN